MAASATSESFHCLYAVTRADLDTTVWGNHLLKSHPYATVTQKTKASTGCRFRKQWADTGIVISGETDLRPSGTTETTSYIYKKIWRIYAIK